MTTAGEPRFIHESAQHCIRMRVRPQAPARPSTALLELWLGLPVLLAVEPKPEP